MIRDTHKIFPRWLQELKRFQALKSEFFLYGNVYDCYYFPVNYQQVDEESQLSYAKFNDIRELLQQYLISEGFELVSYFDIIDGLAIKSIDESVTLDSIVNALQLKHPDIDSFL